MAQMPIDSPPSGGSWPRSVAALMLGIVLALIFTKLFSFFGWGGEFASQTAGAASGAAPLLLDGILQRRHLYPKIARAAGLRRLRLRQPAVLVASIFAFALLLFDSAFGYIMFHVTRLAIRASDGDQAKFTGAFIYVGLVQAAITLVVTAMLGAAAAHRLQHPKRWIWFGMGIYTAVRIAMVLIGKASVAGMGPALLTTSAVLLGLLLTCAALVGTWWARRTQGVFDAAAYFRRLPREDQEAALALLSSDDLPGESPKSG